MNYAFLNDWIRRWRHARGYGVHSPLAFRIVKECVHPDSRYGFYSDPYLDFEYHDDSCGLRRGRLIIRILHLLRPSHIWMPDADKRIITAIKMIMPRLRCATQKKCPEDTDFIISFSNPNISAHWERMTHREECGMLIFGKPELIPEGATLEIESKDFHILLRRPGMQKVKYEI